MVINNKFIISLQNLSFHFVYGGGTITSKSLHTHTHTDHKYIVWTYPFNPLKASLTKRVSEELARVTRILN